MSLRVFLAPSRLGLFRVMAGWDCALQSHWLALRWLVPQPECLRELLSGDPASLAERMETWRPVFGVVTLYSSLSDDALPFSLPRLREVLNRYRIETPPGFFDALDEDGRGDVGRLVVSYGLVCSLEDSADLDAAWGDLS